MAKDPAQPTPEYSTESWWPIRRAFLELWPGVSAEDPYSVLRKASELGTRDIQALLLEAIELGGRAAADLLMGPVAATFPLPDYRDRHGTMHAIDALVRAGGDPTPALSALVEALGDRHCRGSAIGALRRAALAGWSLEPVREALEAADDPHGDVAKVCRLAFAVHPEREARVEALQQIYAQQPVGNLREGLGLVEHLLNSNDAEVRAIADRAITELLDAGPDLYRTWFALLPALRHVLEHGGDAERRDALETLADFRVTLSYTAGHSEAEAREAARPELEALLVSVVPQLASSSVRVATQAAEVVRRFAEQGASLADVRDAVDTALRDPRVAVRSECSTALSHDLRRIGEEPELPHHAAYRRTYALDDRPVDDAEPRVCALCGAKATRFIYQADNGAQFYRVYTSELHCTACGRYFPQVFQAPG